MSWWMYGMLLYRVLVLSEQCSAIIIKVCHGVGSGIFVNSFFFFFCIMLMFLVIDMGSILHWLNPGVEKSTEKLYLSVSVKNIVKVFVWKCNHYLSWIIITNYAILPENVIKLLYILLVLCMTSYTSHAAC